jgi:D-3-phosphoglycerate dehydrogenase
MLDWNILIADALDPSALAILEGGGKPDDRAGISAEDLLEIIGSYDALIVRGRMKVTKEVIQAAGQLKVIGRAGVGVDNIDLAAAQAAKITVVNAPLSTTIAVAELTLGLMLALVRELPRADRGMKAGQWDKKELEGLELHGKTLGIVGMGNIGSAVARRAAAFGMSILGYDTLIEAETITERGAEPVGLPELYRRAACSTARLSLP